MVGVVLMHEIGRKYTPLELMTRLNDVEVPNASDTLFVVGDVDLLRVGRCVTRPAAVQFAPYT